MNDIKNKYSTEEKPLIIDNYMNGKSFTDIVSDSGIARSTVYSWSKQYQKNSRQRENKNNG